MLSAVAIVYVVGLRSGTLHVSLLQVFLPEDALEELTVVSFGEVTVLPGFAPPSFTLSAALGNGDINIMGIDTRLLSIETAG
jgi:hypothetical protein